MSDVSGVVTREQAMEAGAKLRAGGKVAGWFVYPAGPGAKRNARWWSAAILPDGFVISSAHPTAAKAEEAAKAALERGMRPLPDREPDGEFACFQTWVNKATSWIGGTNSLCADAQGRVCRIGADFMRARDEGTYPVRFWYGEGRQTPQQQAESRRATRRALGTFKFKLREAVHGR